MKGNSYVSLLLWSSLCPTCAAALTFRNFSPSPLLSKSTGQGVSSVVAALCSAGNKTGSLTRGCIACNTQQSIVGKTQRVPNVAVLTPQWYFDGAGKRGRAQAWVQLYPHPAASASSPRVTHQEATCDHFVPAQHPACVTLPSALTTVDMHGKKQRQALCLPGPRQPAGMPQAHCPAPRGAGPGLAVCLGRTARAGFPPSCPPTESPVPGKGSFSQLSPIWVCQRVGGGLLFV